MLTIFKKGCNPTECLPLVTAHQPGQGAPRLFKGMHLFSAREKKKITLSLHLSLMAVRFRVLISIQMLHILFEKYLSAFAVSIGIRSTGQGSFYPSSAQKHCFSSLSFYSGLVWLVLQK